MKSFTILLCEGCPSSRSGIACLALLSPTSGFFWRCSSAECSHADGWLHLCCWCVRKAGSFWVWKRQKKKKNLQQTWQWNALELVCGKARRATAVLCKATSSQPGSAPACLSGVSWCMKLWWLLRHWQHSFFSSSLVFAKWAVAPKQFVSGSII